MEQLKRWCYLQTPIQWKDKALLNLNMSGRVSAWWEIQFSLCKSNYNESTAKVCIQSQQKLLKTLFFLYTVQANEKIHVE